MFGRRSDEVFLFRLLEILMPLIPTATLDVHDVNPVLAGMVDLGSQHKQDFRCFRFKIVMKFFSQNFRVSFNFDLEPESVCFLETDLFHLQFKKSLHKKVPLHFRHYSHVFLHFMNDSRDLEPFSPCRMEDYNGVESGDLGNCKGCNCSFSGRRPFMRVNI